MARAVTARPPRAFRARWVLVALSVAGCSVAVMQTLALPLVPLLPERLGISTADASWAVTATALAGRRSPAAC